MENETLINVLWIDDQPSESFMDYADNKGIKIKNFLCVDDGIKCLKDIDISWDAIILDANCKIHSPNEIPDINALSEAINKLHELKIELPWFVYTAGGYQGEESLKHIISKERAWDDRQYYKKPSQMDELFFNLKNAVLKMPATNIKLKYKDVCSFYPGQDLFKILVAYEQDDFFDRDVTLANSIRDILDWIMNYCEQAGVLPIKFNKTNLNECSSVLSRKEMEKFVPVYIQKSFHSCVSYANAGSHRCTDIKKDIKKGLAPYLNRSAVQELLNILYWCSRLPVEEDEKQKFKKQIKSVLADLFVKIAEGIVEKDTQGIFYCGENHSLYRHHGIELIGKKINILEDKENTSPSRRYYNRTVVRWEIAKD